MKIKIGMGYDLHRLESGRKLYLGGVEIPFPKGLKGHSDGDCLIHAMADALLGAMGEKDIGQCFPDTDETYKDIRSTELLVMVMKMLQERDLVIINIDAIIIAEEPKLADHIPRMKKALGPLLGLGAEDLGIKAKTNEGIGLLGLGEAMAAWASVLVVKSG